MTNEFVSIGEASEILGIDQQKLRRMDDKGILHPARRFESGRRLYSRTQLERFKERMQDKEG